MLYSWQIIRLMNMRITMELPQVFPIRQRLAPSPGVDIAACLHQGLASWLPAVKPGARIALCLGSRGIDQIELIARKTLQLLSSSGAKPFVLPAMGSHGGATAEGQMGLLAGYGLTPQSLGVPFAPSMEVELIGTTPSGVPVYCSEEALKADHIVLVNRIKPHTDFHGTLGSGLLKMMVVGLGKQAGATAFHAAAFRLGYEATLREMAQVFLAKAPILGGVAIIEDQSHALCSLNAVPAAELLERETALCQEAAKRVPALPFHEIDLLIVDQMGKNLSGTGMDPAVIGRCIHGYSLREDVPHRSPWVRRLFVRGLSPESGGNAIGLGMADFTTHRLVQSVNWDITRLNSLTALSLQGAKIPLSFATDLEAIETAVRTLGLSNPRAARIVRIANTLSLERMVVSTAFQTEVRALENLEVLASPTALAFDAEGNLT